MGLACLPQNSCSPRSDVGSIEKWAGLYCVTDDQDSSGRNRAAAAAILSPSNWMENVVS